MSWSYDYHADARIERVTDAADDRFDRLQQYDHAGRLQEGYTGRQARGLEQTTPADNPYRQSMQYDVWNNMTSKSGRFWRQWLSDSSTYINNRRQYWSYDAEGNVVGGDGKSHTYDAAGKQTFVASATETVGGSGTGHPVQSGWEIAQTYNVEGQPIKRLETRRIEEMVGEGPQTNITETVTTTYYLYSSVLGEQLVELDGNGVKTKGYVYANGERLAKQEGLSAVRWYYPNAGTNSWVEEWDGGSAERQEMDPMGAEVGTSDPYLSFADPSYYKDLHPEPRMLYLEGGDPFDYSGGHTLDGMPISQSDYNRLIGKAGGMLVADVFTRHVDWRDGNRVGLTLTYLGSAMLTPRPQRQQQQPQNTVTAPIGDLKANLQKILNQRTASGTCEEYTTKLLAQAAKMSAGNYPHIKTIMEGYEKITGPKGGGYILKQVKYDTVDGDLFAYGARLGQVWLVPNRQYGSSMSAQQIAEFQSDYAWTALHETFHLARQGGYSDEEMAAAAYELAGMDLPKTSLTGFDRAYFYTGKFDNELMKHCPKLQVNRR